MTHTARDAILDAAFRLFLERGYEATSLSRILEAVPYSKGAVYHHFANKEALLDAVVERFFSAPIAASGQSTEATGAGLAHRFVDDYVATIRAVEEFANASSYYAFMTAIAPRARDAIRAAQDDATDRLAAALDRDGRADAEATAADLVGLTEGRGLLAVLRGDALDAAELHAAVDRILSSRAQSA